MTGMRFLLRTLASLLGLGFGLMASAADKPAGGDLEGLLRNSPFGNRSGDPTAASAGANPLELRGVFMDHGETFFSVYETSSHSSRWVGLNETGNPFTVRDYDAATNEVKIDYQGRSVALALKQAKILALATPLPGPERGSAIPMSAPSNGPQPGLLPGAPSDEATRLAAIAQEIGRRRALRQQAIKNPPLPQNVQTK